MMLKALAQKLYFLAFYGFAATALVSCGGSGDSDDTETTAGRSGTVGILLTDMPADPTLFDAINASIESIDLIGADDEGRVNLYSGPTRTYDLLRLRNEAVPFTFRDDVPEGSYCKIRLVLSDLELVLADNTPQDPDDNETDHPQLPGNGKLDLIARDCFTVGGGEVVTIQLDIDAGNSIHVKRNSKGYMFRPVIFVNLLNQDFDARLVRLEGEIKRVDQEGNRLLLCGALPSMHSDRKGCASVRLGDESAFFDNVDYSGEPRPLPELLSEDKIGQHATVVGRPRFRVDPHIDVDVPEGHNPPPGECKLWELDLEPGRQAGPIDCDDLPDLLPENTIVVTHDGPVVDRFHPLMVVDGLVVELGDFQRVAGEVATDADIAGFGMNVTRSAPPIDPAMLDVALQQGGAGINGTRIVSKSGKLLGAADVIAPLAVQVDGVLEDIGGGDSMLKAALVIVERDVTGAEQVTGTILSIGENSLTLDPDADVVCNASTTQLEVALADDIEILTVTITGDGSLIEPGGEPVRGQTVGMNGSCGASGYETDNLVIVEDLRP